VIRTALYRSIFPYLLDIHSSLSLVKPLEECSWDIALTTIVPIIMDKHISTGKIFCGILGTIGSGVA